MEEICHASFGYHGKEYYNESHGKSWRKKMEKHAKLARKLKQPLLAAFIEGLVKRARLWPREDEDLEGDIFNMDDWTEEQFEREGTAGMAEGLR